MCMCVNVCVQTYGYKAGYTSIFADGAHLDKCCWRMVGCEVDAIVMVVIPTPYLRIFSV